MEKLYTQELQNEQLNPKQDTISFLLNYSKSFKVDKTKKERQLVFHLN